ncbi:MAG: cytochrome c-type biogenesis protein [Dehalococcoidia bacterium]
MHAVRARWIVVAVVLAALAWSLAGVEVARAQSADDTRALHIEQRLLCPQCTNLRLDVCDTILCADMRREVRDRVAQGQSDTEIIAYFQGRYGQRVLADVPRSGFNLVLFAWVGGSLLVVAVGGAFVLLRLRRTASAPPARTLDAAEERWLDEQVRDGDGR